MRTRPLFSGGSAEALGRLTQHVRRTRLPAGAFLFREGDPANHVFVIEDGHLEVLHEQTDSARRLFVADLRRGAVVGELGVMRGDARTASVRAVEPTTVISLPGRDFVAFVRSTPTAALRLAEMLAERTSPMLLATRDLQHATGEIWWVERTEDVDGALAAAIARAVWDPEVRSAPPTIWCAEGARVPLGRAHGLAFEPLVERLRPLPGEVEVVLGPIDALPASALDISALISGTSCATPDSVDPERHLVVSTSAAVSATLVRLQPQQLHETAERLVRTLEGRTIGLALGGGGALGLCHLGVLEVLARERIPVDILAGTSAGALVGGVVLARGLDFAKRHGMQLTRGQLFSLVDPSFFFTGLLEGRRVLEQFRKLTENERIDRLPIPFAALALDLETGQERTLAGGPLAEAIRASVSLPSVFAPFSYEGEEGVVDGGLYIDPGGVNNVPVDVVREMGASRVVGVNVITRPPMKPPWRNWSPIMRGKMMAYAEMMGFARNGERQTFTADVAVLPDTTGFGFTQFYRCEELMDAGRAAAEEQLPHLRALAAR